MICVECYQANPDGVNFCIKCGCPFNKVQTNETEQTNLLVGRYRMISPLSEGGAGSVHLGYDVRLNKLCAIKELFKKRHERQSKDSTDIKLFKREVELLANLRHPNMPCVTDYFVEDNRYYLVMDYIEGRDLEVAIEEEGGYLPEQQVMEWAIQVCRVMEYLHNQVPSIVHGDIKPANLIIRKSDGYIILVDFGSASVVSADNSTNDPYGTEGYAAPEQYLGILDPKCDIYSLGVTLYELLTGYLPENNFSFTSVKKLRPELELSEELDKIILKSVQFKPELRYQNASHMKQDLLTAYNEKYAPMGNTYKTNMLIISDIPEASEIKKQLKDITVMVVDDEENLCETFIDMCSLFSGVEVIAQASDGEEAVELFKSLEEKPDVILMDINMPVMNGIEAIKEILKIEPDTKIIMLTAFLEEPLFISAFMAGAAGYIHKIGTSWKELEESIRLAWEGGYPISQEANSFFIKLFKGKKLSDITSNEKNINTPIIPQEFEHQERCEELVFPSKKKGFDSGEIPSPVEQKEFVIEEIIADDNVDIEEIIEDDSVDVEEIEIMEIPVKEVSGEQEDIESEEQDILETEVSGEQEDIESEEQDILETEVSGEQEDIESEEQDILETEVSGEQEDIESEEQDILETEVSGEQEDIESEEQDILETEVSGEQEDIESEEQDILETEVSGEQEKIESEEQDILETAEIKEKPVEEIIVETVEIEKEAAEEIKIEDKPFTCPLCSSKANRINAKFCKDCGQKLLGEPYEEACKYLSLINNLLDCKSLNTIIVSIQKSREHFDEKFFKFLDRRTELLSLKNDTTELINSMTYLCKVMDNLKMRKFLDTGEKKLLQAKTEKLPDKEEKTIDKEDKATDKEEKIIFKEKTNFPSGGLKSKKKSESSWRPSRVKLGDKSTGEVSVTEYRQYVRIINDLKTLDDFHNLNEKIKSEQDKFDGKFFAVFNRQIDFAIAENKEDTVERLKIIRKIIHEQQENLVNEVPLN